MIRKILFAFFMLLFMLNNNAFAQDKGLLYWDDFMGLKIGNTIEGESISAQLRRNLTKDKPVYLEYRLPYRYVSVLHDYGEFTYDELQVLPHLRNIEAKKGNAYYETCYDEHKQKVMQKALNSLFGSKGPKKVYERLEINGVLYDKGKLSKKPAQYQEKSFLLNSLAFLYSDSNQSKNVDQYKYEQFSADFITPYSSRLGFRCERYSNSKEVYTYIFDGNNKLVGFAEGGSLVGNLGFVYDVLDFKVGGFDESLFKIHKKK